MGEQEQLSMKCRLVLVSCAILFNSWWKEYFLNSSSGGSGSGKHYYTASIAITVKCSFLPENSSLESLKHSWSQKVSFQSFTPILQFSIRSTYFSIYVPKHQINAKTVKWINVYVFGAHQQNSWHAMMCSCITFNVLCLDCLTVTVIGPLLHSVLLTSLSSCIVYMNSEDPLHLNFYHLIDNYGYQLLLQLAV